MGQSIPLACQDWAGTKAAYRFFSNDKVTPDKILDSHKSNTHKRIKYNEDDFTLILHDTTEIDYTSHQSIKDLSYRKRKPLLNLNENIKDQHSYSYGLFLHASMAITTSGVPLGIPALKFYDRDQFKGPMKEREVQINNTGVPIYEKESYKWIENIDRTTSDSQINSSKLVHIGDREADIFELFELCDKTETNFLVRAARDRKVDGGNSLLFDYINNNESTELFELTIKDINRKSRTSKIKLSYGEVEVLPPHLKRTTFLPLKLYYIQAEEIYEEDSPPSNPVLWRLLTNLTIKNFSTAREKVFWYSLRWNIETFFKVLKTGCKIEDCRLQSKVNLKKYIALMSVVSWRIFWMTLITRESPKCCAEICFTKLEVKVLNKLGKKREKAWSPKGVKDYYILVAKMGGFLGRKSDGNPGILTTWRGYLRLQDVILGQSLG